MENALLKKLGAELKLDKAVLQDVLSKKVPQPGRIAVLSTIRKVTTSSVIDIPGQIRLGSTFKNVEHGLQNGTFTAFDVSTGKITWNQTVPQPTMGGALVTAGNLAFMGEGKGWLDAFNSKTAQKLWNFFLGASVPG